MSGRGHTSFSAPSLSRSRVGLLVAVFCGCLAFFSSRATAAPIILPSAHPLAHDGRVSFQLVPPAKAKECEAWFGSGGHTGRQYPVTLHGPSRRLSWRIAARGRGEWTVAVSCGTKANPYRLGTTSRTFELGGRRGRPHLRVLPNSFMVRRGTLPARPPRPRSVASASSSSEIDTGAAGDCTNDYMSKAYSVGAGFGTRVGFTPKKYKVPDISTVIGALETCVHLPPLNDATRKSLMMQLGCHNFYGPAPGPGVTWDIDLWREAPEDWHDAFAQTHGCDHWNNWPPQSVLGEFDGWIVQGSLDTSSQKAAYVLEPAVPDAEEWMKSHILTTKAFGCVKAAGHPGPIVLPSAFLAEEVSVKGTDIGDGFCATQPAPPGYGPPPGAQAGTLYLAQGPAAPGAYWYAVSLVGYPPQAGVAVTCRDSVSPGGFLTFTMHTDQAGDATSTTGCYSGDGPEHWVTALGNESNRVTWGASPGSPSSPAPPPQQTWSEQETPNHPVNTFTNYHNASGMGPAIASGQWVQVSCKVYDPTIASVNPDGYWYRIASSPWNGAYYSPANTFMNGDPYGGPYTHNTDFAVPDC